MKKNLLESITSLPLHLFMKSEEFERKRFGIRNKLVAFKMVFPCIFLMASVDYLLSTHRPNLG